MAWGFVSGTALCANVLTATGTSAFTAGCVNGNFIIVPVTVLNSASDLATACADTEGNQYFKVVSRPSLDTSLAVWHAWYIARVTNGSGATNTVTVTFGTNTTLRKMFSAFQYSGLNRDAANSVDNSTANAFNLSGNTIMSGALNAAAPDELLLTLISRGGGSMTPVTTPSYTQRSPGTSQYQVADRISVAGSNSYTATLSAGGGGSTTVLFSLRGVPLKSLTGVGL